MTLASIDEGVQSTLRSIDGNRLALLLGAGLSIPSGLPSAQDIADRAKQTYDGRKPPGESPLSSDIEEQAKFFYQRGELDTLYIQTLVDKDAFYGPPNEGHRAVADFLLTGAVRGAVSTNYDTLIEAAGQHLYGAVEVALDGAGTALVQRGAPLLKIHGCWAIDPLHTVWTPRQLDDPGIVRDRIQSSESWLTTHLPNRDLLVVGFGAEWSYLNDVIGRSLGQITPARVVIVDMNDPEQFRHNAPDLTGLGDRAHQQAERQGRAPAFLYVKCSSAEFFGVLRDAFSRGVVRQTLSAGAGAYVARSGIDAPDPSWLEPAFTTNDDLWLVRRDLEGCSPNDPSRSRTPPAGQALGLTMIELQAAGGVPEGPYWRLPSGELVRVLNGSNRTLDAMKSEYDRDMTPVTSPTVVVAVGADDSPLPGSIARSNPATAAKASSVRGAQPQWFTRSQDFADLLS